jgi:thioesterase domain-containing protein
MQSALPVLFSVRGWTEEVNPAYITFVDELRATGVEVIDIFPDHEGCSTVGEWAQRATDEILQRHSQGEPLHLLGYCAGGSLLHESVRQLEARNVQPACLGFIDVRGSNPKERLARGIDSQFQVRWMQRVRFQLERLTPPDRESLASVLRSVLRTRGWRSSKRHIPAIHSQARLAATWEFNSITTPAFAYNCPIAIDKYWPGNPSLGRAALLQGGFIIRFIEGTHETCIAREYAANLIARIAADRSQTGGRSPFV